MPSDLAYPLRPSASLVSVDVAMITMPARQREHDYGPTPTVLIFPRQLCSRHAGISVHVGLETLFTMSRNMHY